LSDSKDTILVQEIVMGSDTDILLYTAYYDADSNPLNFFSGRKLRQYIPGFGSACLVQGTEEYIQKELTDKIVKSIGYSGLAASEFKICKKTGKVKLIEINARPGLWYSITSASGRKIIQSAYKDLIENQEIENIKLQNNNIRWIFTIRNLISIVMYRFGQFSLFERPVIQRSFKSFTFPVFKIDDPLPSFASFFILVLKILKK